jgi:hypothetical protein
MATSGTKVDGQTIVCTLAALSSLGDGDAEGDGEGDGEGDDGQLPVMSVRATLVGEESSCHNAVMDLEIQVVHDES